MKREAVAARRGPAGSADPRYLEVVGIEKSFRGQKVVEGLDFAVAEGELVSLLGPSGCGKTTLLRLVAGLIAPDAGSIAIGPREVTRLPAHRRNVSVVFQNYALFPHLNVRENVAFGLRARGWARDRIAQAADEVLALVRMDAFAGRAVSALSGGQQQRVAVARALAVEPDLLLLDEPFSALDRKLRETMQLELKTLLRARNMTAVFVTHDQDEALALSDRIAVMNAGRIEQFDTPGVLYARPRTPFVLSFVGLSNRLSGTVVAAGAGESRVSTAHGEMTVPASLEPGARVVVAVRPELVSLGGGGAGDNGVAAEVADIMHLGARTHIHCLAGGQDPMICERPGQVGGASIGDTVRLSWAVSDTLVYVDG